MKFFPLIILITFLLSGCVTTKTTPYPSATRETKEQLFQDLASGKLKIGATLEYVRSTYGEPETITTHNEKTLIIYRRPTHYDSAYIWFDENKQLESWSH